MFLQKFLIKFHFIHQKIRCCVGDFCLLVISSKPDCHNSHLMTHLCFPAVSTMSECLSAPLFIDVIPYSTNQSTAGRSLDKMRYYQLVQHINKDCIWKRCAQKQVILVSISCYCQMLDRSRSHFLQWIYVISNGSFCLILYLLLVN